jgi:hypothetical protein
MEEKDFHARHVLDRTQFPNNDRLPCDGRTLSPVNLIAERISPPGRLPALSPPEKTHISSCMTSSSPQHGVAVSAWRQIYTMDRSLSDLLMEVTARHTTRDKQRWPKESGAAFVVAISGSCRTWPMADSKHQRGGEFSKVTARSDSRLPNMRLSYPIRSKTDRLNGIIKSNTISGGRAANKTWNSGVSEARQDANGQFC